MTGVVNSPIEFDEDNELVDAEIPSAACYVLATDTFFSDWGFAKGVDNVVCLPCESYEEAVLVERYCETRSEMKRVRIVTTKPRRKPQWLISVFDRETVQEWARKGELG